MAAETVIYVVSKVCIILTLKCTRSYSIPEFYEFCFMAIKITVKSQLGA